MDHAQAILSVRDLRISYGTSVVVKDISFTVARGETIAIVGESGSGKSQTALATLKLLGPGVGVAGAVTFEGMNLLTLSERRLNAIRGRRIAMVFQEPMSA